MTCPACGSGEMEVVHGCEQPDRKMVGQRIEYVECLICGLVKRTPQPDKAELRAYYEKAWQFSEPRPKRCLDFAAKFISEHVSGSFHSALDVGAKDSALLDAVLLAGVEFQQKAVLDAKAGDGVEVAWLGEGYESDDEHDLVTATHVLEHALDPRQFTVDLAKLLTPGGYAYIEVPSLEIGFADVSACDDINPNHLWHFTLTSLCALARRASLRVIAAASDSRARGWPCNRIIARPAMWTSEMAALASEIDYEYALASRRISDDWQDGDALYGASFSCWRLLEQLGPRAVFDLHKTGQIRGCSILAPSALDTLGIKRVWLTPRFWNSQKEIGEWLKKAYPAVEVLCPYASLITK